MKIEDSMYVHFISNMRAVGKQAEGKSYFSHQPYPPVFDELINARLFLADREFTEGCLTSLTNLPPLSNDTLSRLQMNVPIEPVELPFDFVWFESAEDRSLFRGVHDSIVQADGKDKTKVGDRPVYSVYAIALRERLISPDYYEYDLFWHQEYTPCFTTPELSTSYICYLNVPVIKGQNTLLQPIPSMCFGLIRGYCEELQKRGKIATVHYPRRFKTKEGGKKVYKKVADVIYVASSKKTLVKMGEDTGYRIDWSHRWEVMGHYRKYKPLPIENKKRKLGMNKFGERTEEYRTWVTPHIKGPDGKPLKKQTRVLTE